LDINFYNLLLHQEIVKTLSHF